MWILFPAHFNEVLISEPARDYISANIAKQNHERNKNKWRSNNLNPVTMQCQLQECELHFEAEKSSYVSCAPEMTLLACQLLWPPSSHFLPCCLRTWCVLADMIHKTMPPSRSLRPCSPPACTPDSCRRLAPGSKAAAERKARGGSVY